MLTTIVRALLTAICVVLAPVAQATSERIITSQASDGSILITLSGTTNCVGQTTVPVSNFTIAGPNVAITSNFPNPGPPCIGSPTPVSYSATANIGHIADGAYSVVWSFVLTPPGTTAFASFLAQFSIAGGALLDPAAVPTMGPLGYGMLVVLMLLLSQGHLRKIVRRTVAR